MRHFTIAVVLLAFATLSSAQSKKAEADILKVMDDQAAAWNRGDLETFMQGYWKSDDLVFASGNNVTRGWQQTLDNYKKTYGGAGKMGALSFTDVTINLISKDAAVVLGSWSLTREKDNPKGKFTLIFRKLKEGWRIVHDHTS
ncbi:MAG TPA: nuclear transport factor 2 family protein [Pyrinomonadaceae bacterium]|nr:nuclear transport factor 2 family protein [Pyrinomonadaceae bacterium]